MTKTLLIFPPHGYFYQPYLSTPLLKGYLEQIEGLDVNQWDMNIDYLSYLWSPKFIDIARESLKNHIDNHESLYYLVISNYLKEQVPKSLAALKDENTYHQIGQARFHKSMLSCVLDLERHLNKLQGITQKLPNELGQIDSLVSKYDLSILYKYIQANLDKVETYDIIGFSITYSEQFLPSLLFAKLIKEKYPEKKVIFGGTTITHYKIEMILEADVIRKYCDFIVFYEGEEALARIIRYVSGDINEVGCNILIPTRPNEYKEDLTRRKQLTAIPNFDGIPLDKYPVPSPIFPILTSKGCYWGKCTFCAHHEGYGLGYQSLGSEYAINVILNLVNKYGAKNFYICDEALPPRIMKRLAEQIVSYKLDIKWISEARAEKAFVNKESVALMKEAGCIALVNGIESGNEEILKALRKGIDLSVAEEYYRLCHDYGIFTAAMFFIGFAGETEEQSEDTFRFIEKNKDILDFAAVGVFHLERGTPVYNSPKQFGIEEITDKNKAYPIYYSYRMRGSAEEINPEVLKNRLRGLFRRYEHILFIAK
ncbi:B12-binding domain-containing radical SAM protein [Geobacillus sp. TFV-3]|uniref:B12-binding domain-containing radical SAM protein n=1 Tax=Geobacillus sp. TFV-3 TaxID=1897059 RepID=UPI001356862F|nr:radical SAM protein [Geobacillus sp. TFV-3]KAF0996739.1 2-hydroxyethylphosphonate methyltransferase [Geobacillus sp. TFV-3]